ncbi:hypothetical protein SAMN05443582_101883 [Phyllobacterium sp. OV277]|nr:hypothetical protein SAMN05443582_101883 [Phyllobacterium sp. OV277]
MKLIVRCDRHPLCPVGHLPHKGGDQPSLLPLHNLKLFRLWESVHANVISPLWGRCPTGQRGVSATAALFAVHGSWFDKLTMREMGGARELYSAAFVICNLGD